MNDRGALTIKDFCEWANIGRTKTYELIQSGDLPVIKIGKKTLIPMEGARDLLKKFAQPVRKNEAA